MRDKKRDRNEMRWRERENRSSWRGEVGLFAAPKLLKPRSCVECKWEGDREIEQQKDGVRGRGRLN